MEKLNPATTLCLTKLGLDPSSTLELLRFRVYVRASEVALMQNQAKGTASVLGLLGYGALNDDPSANWGIGGSFRRVATNDPQYAAFVFELPVIEKRKEGVCRQCQGTEAKSNCRYCDGDGFEKRCDYQAALQIIASHVLLAAILQQNRWVGFIEADTDQLFWVESGIQQSMFALFGQYSARLRAAGKKILDSKYASLETIIWPSKIMRTAWRRMYPFDRYERDGNIHARVQDGWPFFSASSDGACLHISGSHTDELGNRGFSDHNIDHPGHWLTLFAGLAATEEIVRNRFSDVL